MRKDWIYFADKILFDLDKVYPRTKSYLVIPRHIRPRLQEHERLLSEALNFLRDHNLVDKINESSYRINDKGKSVMTSGVHNYMISLKFPETNKKETKTIKKYWLYAAIVVVLFFCYYLIQNFQY